MWVSLDSDFAVTFCMTSQYIHLKEIDRKYRFHRYWFSIKHMTFFRIKLPLGFFFPYSHFMPISFIGFFPPIIWFSEPKSLTSIVKLVKRPESFKRSLVVLGSNTSIEDHAASQLITKLLTPLKICNVGPTLRCVGMWHLYFDTIKPKHTFSSVNILSWIHWR